MCPGGQLNAWKCYGLRRAGHITWAGTLHGQSRGRQVSSLFRGGLLAIVMSSAAVPVKNIPRIVKAIPGSGENRSSSPRNPVRLYPGIVFTFARNPFHLAPESALDQQEVERHASAWH